MDLDDRYGVQQTDATGPQHPGAAQLRSPLRRGDQHMLLVAQRGGGEQPTARPGRGDGQIVMTGRETGQYLVRGPEGGADGQALGYQRGERRERAFGEELRGTGEMEGAGDRVPVQARLCDLGERVQVRRHFVGKFVADAGGGDAAGVPEEERTAQLAFQCPDLAGHRRLGEAE